MRPDLVPAAEAVWNLTLGDPAGPDPLQLFEVLSAAELERLLSAAKAAIVAPALALHYPALNTPDRQPVCPDCWGRSGAHPCGCWNPGPDLEPVCGTCQTHDRHPHAVPYPCPTVLALGVDVTPPAPDGAGDTSQEEPRDDQH